MTMAKKIYKSNKNKIIAGVCGGIGEYLDWDATVVRLLLVLITFFTTGGALLFYLIAALVIPTAPEADDIENLKSANINEEKSNAKSGSVNKDSKMHSDKEFDSYFKKEKE